MSKGTSSHKQQDDSETETSGDAGTGNETSQEPTASGEDESPHAADEGGPTETAENEGADGGDGAKQGGRRGHVFGLFAKLRWPSTRKAQVILLAVVFGLVAAITGGYVWVKAGQLPDGAAFRIDDRVVTVDELNDVTDTWRAMYGVKAPEDKRKLDGFRRDTARAYAVSLLLDVAAAERGIAVGEKAAQDALSRFIERQAGEGAQARDAFVRALAESGTSERAVRDEVKKQLIMAQLFKAVTDDVGPVSDRELADAFATRKDKLGTPERRRIGNIVVRTKEDADRLAADLRDGAAFASLARQHSIDEATRNKGGDLGSITRDQLQQRYGDAAFAAEAGEVFGPVRNKFGWNVGIVKRTLPPVPAKFDDVKDQLRQQLAFEKAIAHWRQWLAGQIKAADIEYADEYRPANPDAPPGDAPLRGGAPDGPLSPPR